MIPGCEREWHEMRGDKTRTLTPSMDIDVRLEIVEIPDRPDYPGYSCLEVIQIDYEDKYTSPPMWTRTRKGEWLHPMSMPKTLIFYMDYRYDLLKDDSDGG